MSKILPLAALTAPPLTCLLLCTQFFHMPVEESVPHISIAMMAVLVHKLAEVKSTTYLFYQVRCRRRIWVMKGRGWQWSRRNLAKLAGWFCRGWQWALRKLAKLARWF